MKSAFFEGMRETPVASQVLVEDHLDSASISYIHLTNYKAGACGGAAMGEKGGGKTFSRAKIGAGGWDEASVLDTTSPVCKDGV